MFSIKPLSYLVSLPHCVSVKLCHVEIPFVGRYFWFLLFLSCYLVLYMDTFKIKKKKKAHILSSVILLSKVPYFCLQCLA